MTTNELVIKNAVTKYNNYEPSDISINDGKVTDISQNLTGEYEIDAQNNLVTESFINGHLHLCKVYTLKMMNSNALKAYTQNNMSGAMTSIELASKIKEQYDAEWILPNVRKALDLAVDYGNLHIRAFVDTDTKAKLEGLKAVLQAKQEYQDKLNLQVVAFPQDGVIRDSGAFQIVEEGLKMGADVVGGIPWIEYTTDDCKSHIDQMFDLAVKYDKDISMLVDDAGDSELRTLEYLAIKTIETGWQGRVTAQHARAIATYPQIYFDKLTYLLKEANIGIISDPQTGPLHCRVMDIYNAGINIGLGQDDICDAYYPFGRNNMPEVAFLSAHLMERKSPEDMEILYELITTKAAKALGIENHELKPGNPANLVILDAKNVWESLWTHSLPKCVISNGKIIAENKYSHRK